MIHFIFFFSFSRVRKWWLAETLMVMLVTRFRRDGEMMGKYGVKDRNTKGLCKKDGNGNKGNGTSWYWVRMTEEPCRWIICSKRLETTETVARHHRMVVCRMMKTAGQSRRSSGRGWRKKTAAWTSGRTWNWFWVVVKNCLTGNLVQMVGRCWLFHLV